MADSDESENAKSNKDLSLKDYKDHKEKVLSGLEKDAEELSSSIKPSVLTKLKTLSEDWSDLDPEIKRLLVELSQCEFSI